MITSGFFNSINHDRVYNAEEMSNYFEGLVTDGVYEMVGGAMEVRPGGGLTVNVSPGRAMIDCRWLKNDADYSITLDPSDIQLDRLDRIVVKLDLKEREMTIEAVKGELATDPTPPVVSDTDTVKYLTLAYVSVKHAVTGLSIGSIYDRRGTADCPYISSLGNSSGMQKLQSSYDVAEESDTFYIRIQSYNHSTDILFVYLNGLLLVEDVEFTVTGTGYNSAIKLKSGRTIRAGNNLTFVILKSR